MRVVRYERTGLRGAVWSRQPARSDTVPVIDRPRFKPHIHVETIKGEGVLLLSELAHSRPVLL